MEIRFPKFGLANTTIWMAMISGGILAVVVVILGFISWHTGSNAFSKTTSELTSTNNPNSSNLQNLGNLGSYLQGTTASLWALAGVCLIFAAFLAQMLQLRLQQNQFERESFETSFFQLLTLHGQVVSDLRDTISGGSTAKGRQLFPVLHTRLRRSYEAAIDGIEVSQDIEELAVRCYENNFFDKHAEILGHYFRNLYHVIKFVADSKLDEANKKRYTSIVRAQLSVYEHALLYYNGISEYGQEKFKELIEKYALLENMKRDVRVNEEHATLYKPEAFGDQATQFRYKSQTQPRSPGQSAQT